MKGWVELHILSRLTDNFALTSLKANDVFSVMENRIAESFICSVMRVKGYDGELLVWESKSEIELALEWADVPWEKRDSNYWQKVQEIVSKPQRTIN